MSPHDKLLTAIFGNKITQDQLQTEEQARREADIAEAQEIAQAANEADDWTPAKGRWVPALHWDTPCAVAHVEGDVGWIRAVAVTATVHGNISYCAIAEDQLKLV
jgi:hypothetical protein